MNPAGNPSWWEHVDLMQLLLGFCLVYVVWTFKRAIENFEKSQEKTAAVHVDLYEKFNGIDRRVLKVETIHTLNGCDDPEEDRRRRDRPFTTPDRRHK